MTILNEPPVTGTTAAPPAAHPRQQSLGKAIVNWVTSTDHKLIGYMYLVTSVMWFFIAGVMALAIRAELAVPGLQVISLEQYNQLFTMHGTIMLFLFATPLFVGFGNVIMPLQIGAPDVAFPRLNMFGYWLFLFGGLVVAAGFLTPGGAASFGWFAYAPLSNAVFSPTPGADLWFLGLALGGLGTILGAVNFITTIFTMRAPGMTMFRMPIFTWTIFITSVSGAHRIPRPRRGAGRDVHRPAIRLGGLRPGEWGRHLVAAPVLVLRAPGGVHHRLALLRHRQRDHSGVLAQTDLRLQGTVFATMAIGALSVAVWAHHMYVTGSVYLPFFALMTMLIAVPTGVKFFNWIGTMWKGSVSMDTPMLWTMGFLITFLFGGLTGIILVRAATGLPCVRQLLRGRPLPLHGVRNGRVLDVRRLLLLVAEDDRQDARRAARQDPLLAAVHRFPGHLLGPALAGCSGHASSLWGLPTGGRLHDPERRLYRRRRDPGNLHTVLHLERAGDLEERSARERR